MRNDTVHKILRGLNRYLIFFSLVAVLVTITLSLFVSTLSKDLGIVLTGETLNRAAKLTFFAVILSAAFVTAFDIIRRKLTTDRITKSIANATRELVNGNFTARISPVAGFATDDNYNEIAKYFNTIAQELGSLETMRTDFVANVSHEMKTPLSVISNYAALLKADDLPDDKRTEYAASIAKATQKLSDMITNILKLNRLENQQIYPKTESFDLSEQLRECILQYESIWEQKSIIIDIDTPDTAFINADSELLSLVWNNLFSNAFKFTENGGKVSLRLYTDESFATVKIADSGCGMTQEVGNRIFEKFYQGDTSHKVQGNGLGLSLVKRVIDILKGEIEVESTVGVGSVFTVRIPRGQI